MPTPLLEMHQFGGGMAIMIATSAPQGLLLLKSLISLPCSSAWTWVCFAGVNLLNWVQLLSACLFKVVDLMVVDEQYQSIEAIHYSIYIFVNKPRNVYSKYSDSLYTPECILMFKTRSVLLSLVASDLTKRDYKYKIYLYYK